MDTEGTELAGAANDNKDNGRFIGAVHDDNDDDDGFVDVCN